jgi:methionine synthase I (cobalamin-dependent)
LAGHGLEEQVREINAAAVRLARDAAGDEVWVGGSMGPIGVAGQVAGQFEPGDMEQIFAEQATALLEAGIDAFVVETIPWLVEMEAALEAIRKLDAKIPVVAMMTFNDEGETQGGETPEIVVKRLSAAGADVIGANCSVGPKPMLDVVARMAHPETILAAMPNAGLPQSVEGRLYMASAGASGSTSAFGKESGLEDAGRRSNTSAMRRAAGLRPIGARPGAGRSEGRPSMSLTSGL